MKLYLKPEYVRQVRNFYEYIFSMSDHQRWDKISDFWEHRMHQISIQLGDNYMDFAIRRDLCLSLEKSWFDRINVYNSLRYLRKLSIARENTEELRAVLKLSLPHANRHETNKLSYCTLQGRRVTPRFLQGLGTAHTVLMTTLLKQHPPLSERPCIVEIGSGAGTMGLVFKGIRPRSTYILVDIPEVLMIAAAVTGVFYGEKRFFFYTGSPITQEIISENDFIFVPHFAVEHVPSDQCSLVLNEGSMGEMTLENVNNYFVHIRRMLGPDGLFLNMNRFNKLVSYAEYPYTAKDRHLLDGMEEFYRMVPRIVWRVKGKRYLRFLPRMLWSHMRLMSLRISSMSKD